MLSLLLYPFKALLLFIITGIFVPLSWFIAIDDFIMKRDNYGKVATSLVEIMEKIMSYKE